MSIGSYEVLDDAQLHRSYTEIENEVKKKIKEVLVFGQSPAFGLVHRTGTVDFPEEVVGSWLYDVTKSKKKLAFFELRDHSNELIRKKAKGEKGKTLSMKYNTINYVLVEVANSPYKCAVHIEAEDKTWTLRPIQEDDSDVVVHWAAALRYRAQLYDDTLLLQQQKALKAILWFQSQYRRRQAIAKVARRKERRAGLLNKALGWLYGGYDDSDTDSEVEEEEEEEAQVAANGFTSVLSAIISDAYAATFASSGVDEMDDKELEAQLEMDEETKKKFKRDLKKTSALVDKNELKPLEHNEIEDEIWENERWVVGGWTNKAATRGNFSDRIGRNGASTLEGAADKMEKIWEVSQEWQVDLSGLKNARCGQDGWIYNLNFGSIESDIAKGKYNIKPKPGHVVRRRRLYRRRVLANGQLPIRTPVLFYGWLGKKGLTTGRWTSRFFVMTNGMKIKGKITGVSLSYFRYGTSDHMKYVASQDLSIWDKLTKKDWRTYRLDSARLEKDPKNPSYFWITLSGERRIRRYFNAGTEEAREMWFKLMKYAVTVQEKRFTLTRVTMQRTLKRKKDNSYDAIQSLPWQVLDSLVPASVDKLVHIAYFDDTFLNQLNKKLGITKFEELVSWSAGDNKGSRRTYEYVLPKTKGRLGSGFDKTRVTEKYRIEARDKGLGMHIMKSWEFHDLPYGNQFRCMVRTVITNWKGDRCRICVSMELQLKNEDEGTFEFLESMMRKYMLQYYTEIWMPLLGKAILAAK